MRAKIAKRRNKKHLLYLISKDKKYNHQIKPTEKNDEDVCNLIPPRKTWIKLGGRSRFVGEHPINSLNKNIKSLSITINKNLLSQHGSIQTEKLTRFIQHIRSCLYSKHYTISKPTIYPKPKERLCNSNSKNICRPIALFNLDDKIIICLINKFLTELFDPYFYEHSYAFRASKKINEKRIVPSHHHAIATIKEYLAKHTNDELWVAECDIIKFYDTVHHYTVKRIFQDLIKRVKRDNPGIYLKPAIRIFNCYLKCYAFNTDVLPKNNDPNYFLNYKITNGKFEWAESEFKKHYIHRKLHLARIGVPQGGALSGLIANIVLDKADASLDTSDKDLLYLRYCDDMIIVHPSRDKCKSAYFEYQRALRDLKLIPHQPAEIENYDKDYWNHKSKMPYCWSSKNNGSVPWVGFVGYEINRNGEIRVRKRSLKKEMQKQFDTVNEIRQIINNKKVSNKTIEESATNKMIGFSVGRVKIWNYDKIINELCWINGFSELNDNKYSRVQLKRLDMCRNRILRRLKKELTQSEDITVAEKNYKRKQLVYYGKPFSYYYQVLQKKNSPMHNTDNNSC